MTTVLRQPTEYNGCVIQHDAEIEVKSITVTISPTEKVELTGGRLALDFISNSYKYGSEVQLIYYTKEAPVIRQRVDGHKGWYRTEIHLSPDQAAQLVRSLR